MTICIFLKNFAIGGAQIHAIRLANYLSDGGFQVKLISRTSDGVLRKTTNKDVTVETFEIENTNNPIKLLSLRKHLLNLIPKGTVVFPNIPNEFRQISRLNLVFRDWRIVYILHMDLKIKQSTFSWLKVMEVSKLINQKYSTIVALTKIQRDRHAKWYNAPKIKAVPNFIDLNHGLAKKGFSKKLRGVSVGRYALQKGYDLLLEAMHLVDKGIAIDVYGNGDKIREELTQSAKEKGIENITFHGKIMNVLEVVSTYDFFVLPSRHEPFGLSLIEAISCGLPAVATDCDGPQEIINENINGILVEKENCESLALGINKLITQIKAGDYSNDKIRNSINHLSLEEIVPQYLEDIAS